MNLIEYQELSQRTYPSIDYNSRVNTTQKLLLEESFKLNRHIQKLIELKQLTITHPVRQLHLGVLGLQGETGEVSDLIKKEIFQGHNITKEQYTNELGDVFWYLTYCANCVQINLDEVGSSKSRTGKELYNIKSCLIIIMGLLDLSLEDVLQYNYNKLSTRYPNGFKENKGGEDK